MKDRKEKKQVRTYIFIVLYALFVIVSYIFGFKPGADIGENFLLFSADIVKMFPAAFIVVGLFTVWVNKSTVEKYFGEASGFKGYIWGIVLACTTLYPFVVVLPMAGALAKKGARLSILMTFLGASAVTRIPMTIFEASFVGLKFTIIRYAVSLPLIIITSILIEKIVGKDYMDKYLAENK